MAYDAGAAVGRLILDTKQWDAAVQKSLRDLARVRSLLVSIARAQAFAASASGKAALQEAAATRVAASKAAELAQKATIASSLVATRGQVRQQTAIAVDGVRTQNRATLMETQHGYRLAEIEARKMAQNHVSAFDRIRQVGVRTFNSIGTTMTRLRYGAQLVATTFVVSFGVVAWQLSKLLGGFAEFEQRMRKATSVTKYTEDEFRAMSAEAETAAKKWGTPARDAADAFLFLGRAGLTAQQQLAAMPSITAASKAMLEDLEETAEGTVNIMNAFNLSFDQTPKVVDMMTEAVNTSTMNLHEFLVSLSYAAKPAAAFNNTMQDVAAMIGIAANAGIRGSKAGTALRYALTQLSSPTAGMRNLLHELNIQVYDASGKMKPFVDILQLVQGRLAGVSEQTRNYTLKTLFGQRALSTMIALFEKGAAGIRAYSKQIANAGNVTQTTAQKQMLAMKSQLERLRETWVALKRHIVESFAPDVVSAIKIITRHVDEWTQAVDNNRERVRSFAKEIVGFFVQFAKITAGAAAFALVARVLGGIVMILQAILSPLGVIIVAIIAVQTAWRTNFLGMRDIGESVFGFLKDEALDFFVTLINGMGKATTFILNEFARIGQTMNINALKVNLVKTLSKQFVGDAVAEEAQHEIYQMLTAGGTKTLEQGVEDALRQYPGFYLSAKGYFTRPGAKQTGDAAYLQELLTQTKALRTATAEATITDIFDSTKTVTDVMKKFFVDTGKAFADTIKIDIDIITNYFKGMVPPELKKALQDILDMLNEIRRGAKPEEFKLKSVGGKKPLVGYGAGAGAKRRQEFPLFILPESLVKDFYGRVGVVVGRFIHKYEFDWKEATARVVEDFKTQQEAFSEMFATIHSDMINAFDDLMKQGSSFVDFMDSLFQSILNSFRRMVATMLANQMFLALFGGWKEGQNKLGQPVAGSGMAKAMWDWLKYLGLGGRSEGGYGTYIPSTVGSIPIGTTSESSLDLDTGEYDVQKRAPKIAFVLNNNTGLPVTAKQAEPPKFDGKQWVINVVMEESVTNPRFREIVVGGV